MDAVDAVVVGAGPNGLSAAVVLARAGLRIAVYEAAGTVGGGARTAELTLPGFRHDICSAVHPLGVNSPFFRSLPLDRFGLEWVHAPLPLAHPLEDGSAAVLDRTAQATAAGLGLDRSRYLQLVGPFLGPGCWEALAADVLRPIASAPPRHPFLTGRFGARAVLPASVLGRAFRDEPARTLWAGLAAHAIAPLHTPTTSGVALLFALAGHAGGWPFPRGGSQSLSEALAGYLRSLGCEVVTGTRIRTLRELPRARAYLLDLCVPDLIAIAGDRLPPRYVARLRRYRHGPAVFKIDYALSGPVPWKAEACARAGSVHVGASWREIASALSAVASNRAPERPFLIASEPSRFDASRAPAGQHVLWVYGHVPYGWPGDLTGAIEGQLERFAPGFRDLVLARAAAGPATLEARNPNDRGGDIAGGAFGGRQALFRPVASRVPYATPDPEIYLCSSATPPGPGVHGLCGYHAARAALWRQWRLRVPPVDGS